MTHDVARAVEIADRVVVLRAGRVILHRDTSEVAPDAFRAEYEAAIA